MNFQEKKVNPTSQRLLTGHRGIPSKAPENTLAGFQLASQNGASWIETDVQLTVDRVPVIFHDREVSRTTDGKGIVSEMTAEHISRLDAGSWFDKAYTEERVPTLQETLGLCLELDLSLHLELKIHPGNSVEELVREVVNVIKSGNFPLEKLVLSSFSREALEYCLQYYPEARRGFITKDRKLDLSVLMSTCELYSVHLNHKIATPKLVSKLKNAGISVAIWTMNDPSRADYFYDNGVDNIMSDCVGAF